MIELFGFAVGSLAQLGTFVTVLVGVGTLLLKFRGQTFDHVNNQVKQYEATCSRLREDVSELIEKLTACEKQCVKDKQELHEEMWGMRKQNLTEQISLINVIMRSVDAPELQTMLRTLESVQIALTSNVLQSQTGIVIPNEDEPDVSKGA